VRGSGSRDVASINAEAVTSVAGETSAAIVAGATHVSLNDEMGAWAGGVRRADGGASTWAIARSRIVRSDGGFYGIGRERIELTSPQ
jgi:hypothetical protein